MTKNEFHQWASDIVPRITPTYSVTGSSNTQILVCQIIAFSAVGATAGALDYLAMILLREALSVDPVTSALIGYTLGGITSYTLNRVKTFRSRRPHKEAVWRFVTVTAIGFLITGVLMSVMVKVMYVNYMIARVFTIIANAFMNFLAYKFWTFSPAVARKRPRT